MIPSGICSANDINEYAGVDTNCKQCEQTENRGLGNNARGKLSRPIQNNVHSIRCKVKWKGKSQRCRTRSYLYREGVLQRRDMHNFTSYVLEMNQVLLNILIHMQ